MAQKPPVKREYIEDAPSIRLVAKMSPVINPKTGHGRLPGLEGGGKLHGSNARYAAGFSAAREGRGWGRLGASAKTPVKKGRRTIIHYR